MADEHEADTWDEDMRDMQTIARAWHLYQTQAAEMPPAPRQELANEIQFRNIAALWVALGKHGPAPRPEKYRDALEVFWHLVKAYGVRHGRQRGIVGNAWGGVPCEWCQIFDRRPESLFCSEICERLAQPDKAGA